VGHRKDAKWHFETTSNQIRGYKQKEESSEYKVMKMKRK
jgi:hypothetical protein